MSLIIRRTAFFASLFIVFAITVPAQVARTSAADLMHLGLTAMGGEEKVRSLAGLHIIASSHRNLLEQSERPEGPYIIQYDQIEEWHDLVHQSWKQVTHSRLVTQPESVSTIVVADGAAKQTFGSRDLPGSMQQIQDATEALALAPERVLLTALASTDLHRLPDLQLQNVPHQAVAFIWQNKPVRIYLNAETHLPTAVEWVSAYPSNIFWSVWGDVTTRVYYSFWWLQNGIHYPLQADIVRDGLPDRTTIITEITFDPKLSQNEFAISPEVRAAFAKRANNTADDRPLGAPAQEPANGIIIIPGAWNTSIVRQADGIVILEAPISSGYSAKVLEEAGRRFPGVRVKAVITTSDAWPHVGGIREYVARGVPVYVVDRSAPLIRRVIKAPRSQYPDALAKFPRQAVLIAVSGKTAVGAGPNRMEIYPIRGETTERQMMVYFPEHKLLYGSDAFQKDSDTSYFLPQTVDEVVNAVGREKLAVDKFFMMHMPVTPWSDLEIAIKKGSAPGPASGSN